MSYGFILIKTKPDEHSKVYSAVEKIAKETHLLYGEYDILAKIESENRDGIEKIVKEKIDTLAEVLDIKIMHRVPGK